MIFLIIRTVAVEIIDRLYVVHRPMGILLPVVAGIRLCITQTTLFVITAGDERSEEHTSELQSHA